MICMKVKTDLVNETKAIEKEVQELQSMSRALKEQSRLKTKVLLDV